MAAWCALNPLALLLIPLEMVSQPDGIGSKPLAIENSQVKRLHRPLWWFALPGGGWRGGRWGAQRRLDRSHGHVREQLVAQRGRQFSRPAQLVRVVVTGCPAQRRPHVGLTAVANSFGATS